MTTIILTATVHVSNKGALFQINPNERLQSYLKSIRKWLNETSFNIILVDNSGYPFNELDDEKKIYQDRFDVISFKENELPLSKHLQNNKSKGASEIFAINYAFYNSWLRTKTNFIIKITGRFFIKQLSEFLNQYDLTNYDAITQSDNYRCELVGCRPDNFWYIFNITLLSDSYSYDGTIETIWRERILKYNNVLACDLFQIDETQRGGVNEKYTTI